MATLAEILGTKEINTIHDKLNPEFQPPSFIRPPGMNQDNWIDFKIDHVNDIRANQKRAILKGLDKNQSFIFTSGSISIKGSTPETINNRTYVKGFHVNGMVIQCPMLVVEKKFLEQYKASLNRPNVTTTEAMISLLPGMNIDSVQYFTQGYYKKMGSRDYSNAINKKNKSGQLVQIGKSAWTKRELRNSYSSIGTWDYIPDMVTISIEEISTGEIQTLKNVDTEVKQLHEIKKEPDFCLINDCRTYKVKNRNEEAVIVRQKDVDGKRVYLMPLVYSEMTSETYYLENNLWDVLV